MNKPESNEAAERAGGSLERLVSVLAAKGPMRAGELGYELWAEAAHAGHDENVQTTMFVRPATKMLYRAADLGLVGWSRHGRSRLWHANDQALRPRTPGLLSGQDVTD